MRAMRNLIVHEYHRVDPQVVWDTVHNDLEPLRVQLLEVLSRGDST